MSALEAVIHAQLRLKLAEATHLRRTGFASRHHRLDCGGVSQMNFRLTVAN
jgi:hypothetical protein